MFIKITFKYSKNVLKNDKLCIKMQSISVFVYITKVADFHETQEMCHVPRDIFSDLL